MLRSLLLALLVLLSFGSGSAHAQQLVITIDKSKASQYGLDPSTLQDSLNSQIGNDLKLADQEAFLQEMSVANALVTKGMGVDYASNPQRFVLGGGVGTAVSDAGVRFNRGADTLPLGGFAFQAAIMGGLNLGAFSDNDSFLRRFMIYGDGLVANTKLDPFLASATNLGAHVQLKLIRPKHHEGLLEWGGLDLTTGYEWSRYELTLSKQLPVDAGDVTWNATGSLGVASRTASVPLEVSTNLRIFIVTAYGGAALDLNQDAITTSDMGLDGPLVLSAGGSSDTVGTASLTLTDQGTVSGPSGRLFAGAQVNLLMVKVYGQVNMGLSSGFGGHLGLRVAM